LPQLHLLLPLLLLPLLLLLRPLPGLIARPRPLSLLRIPARAICERCWLVLAAVGWWCPTEEGRQNRMEAKSWSLGYRRGYHPCNLMYSQNSGLDIWQHSKADIEKVFERG